jgi:hypothetical protein
MYIRHAFSVGMPAAEHVLQVNFTFSSSGSYVAEIINRYVDQRHTSCNIFKIKLDCELCGVYCKVLIFLFMPCRSFLRVGLTQHTLRAPLQSWRWPVPSIFLLALKAWTCKALLLHRLQLLLLILRAVEALCGSQVVSVARYIDCTGVVIDTPSGFFLAAQSGFSPHAMLKFDWVDRVFFVGSVS